MNDFSLAQKYTPEQQAEIRRALTEQAKANAQGQRTVSLIPTIDGKPQAPIGGLERTPDTDDYQTSMLCASIKPKDVQTGLTSATAILIAFKALAEAGFDVWDMFTQKFGKPKNKQEEQALKAIFAPNPEGKANLDKTV